MNAPLQALTEDSDVLSEVRLVMSIITQVANADVLGELMERAKEAKQILDRKRAEFDAAETAFKDLKICIKDALRDVGISGSKLEGIATATITSKTVPTVRDWDTFYAWIMNNNMPQLLQKRVLQTGYKELRDQGIEIPGVEDFELEDLAFRVIK